MNIVVSERGGIARSRVNTQHLLSLKIINSVYVLYKLCLYVRVYTILRTFENLISNFIIPNSGIVTVVVVLARKQVKLILKALK